jgi:hypothetical protein
MTFESVCSRSASPPAFPSNAIVWRSSTFGSVLRNVARCGHRASFRVRRSSENFTSSAVSSVPSENVTPLRRKKSQRLPSWDIDQRSASPGSAFHVCGLT